MRNKYLPVMSIAMAGTLAVGMAASTAHAGNILLNGNFSTADATTSTGAADWNSVLGLGAGTTGSVTRLTGAGAYTGDTAYLEMTGTGAGGAGSYVAATNTTTAGTITPGTNYTLSFEANGTNGISGVNGFILGFFNSSGGKVGQASGTLALTSAYQLFSVSGAAPTGASYAEAIVHLSMGAVAGDTGKINIDDVSINSPAVPEPGVLGTLALGGLGMLLIGRKRVIRRTA